MTGSTVVIRLRAYRGSASDTTECFNGLRIEAADLIERLRAEVEALRQQQKMLFAGGRPLDELVADAERYRWLRDGNGPQSSRWSRWRIEHWASPGPSWSDIRGSDLDATIDAARAK